MSFDKIDIFSDALEISSEQERATFLRNVCEGDTELLAQIEALIESHSDDDLFEKFIPPKVTSEVLSETINIKIDGYNILEEIGSGGCGVVYKAEEISLNHRPVALKVIGPDLTASSEVVNRFQAEIKALAKLKHTNIAAVYAAGITEMGCPYFTMELVCGQAITEYCDSHHLTIFQRLELFAKICHAVHSAHEQGIIHRDIKPSNILVADENNEPLPKLIDFGIAKLADSSSQINGQFKTRIGQIIGTPTFMSPEQTGLLHLEVDRRTDIYSLGVLLYELLIGHLPLTESELGRNDFLMRIRKIRPVKPSRKFARLLEKERLIIAQCRQTDAAALYRALAGDLDSIVTKCLQKHPDHRYASADILAKHIQKFLDQPKRQHKKSPSRYFFTLFVVALALICGSLWLQSSQKSALHFALKQSHDIHEEAVLRSGDNQLNSDAQNEKARMVAQNTYEELKKIPVTNCPADFIKLWKEYLKAVSNYSGILMGHPDSGVIFRQTFQLWKKKAYAAQADCDSLYKLVQAFERQ